VDCEFEESLFATSAVTTVVAWERGPKRQQRSTWTLIFFTQNNRSNTQHERNRVEIKKGRCRWSDTGGNNQAQGRRSQGQEVRGNGGRERRGFQNKRGHKTQKLQGLHVRCNAPRRVTNLRHGAHVLRIFTLQMIVCVHAKADSLVQASRMCFFLQRLKWNASGFWTNAFYFWKNKKKEFEDVTLRSGNLWWTSFYNFHILE